MMHAEAVRDLLMGAGGFVGMSMTGVGAYRLLSKLAQKFTRVPDVLEMGVKALNRAAEAQENSVKALRDQSAILDQVVETKDLVVKALGQISEVRDERELISRELRLMSRRIESYSREEVA